MLAGSQHSPLSLKIFTLGAICTYLGLLGALGTPCITGASRVGATVSTANKMNAKRTQQAKQQSRTSSFQPQIHMALKDDVTLTEPFAGSMARYSSFV